MVSKSTHKVYAVFLVDSKHWRNINRDLRRKGYSNLRSIIPSVSILKKKKNGKVFYDKYPVLFEYGFMKMSTNKAYDRVFLNKLRRDIPGIKAWIRDSFSIHPKKKKKRIDNKEDWDDFSKVAIVNREDIRHLKKIALSNRVFNSNHLISIHPGDYITLRGYPFEGVGAIVEDISLADKTARVIILPDTVKMNLKISLDNLLYSPYIDMEVPEDFTSNHKPPYLSDLDKFSTT